MLAALAARVVLARTAEKTLDVQYYIWHNDESGKLLMKELLDAADRGTFLRISGEVTYTLPCRVSMG